MASAPPKGLKTRGRALWRRLECDRDSPEGNLALEACRMADRLDELFAISDASPEELMRGASWRVREVVDNEADREVYVEIKPDRIHAEIRASQQSLKQLITGAMGVKHFEPATPKDPVSPGGGKPSSETSSVVDEFTAARRNRKSS